VETVKESHDDTEFERSFLDRLIKLLDTEINDSMRPPAQARRTRIALAVRLLEQDQGEIDADLATAARAALARFAPSFRDYSADFDDGKPWEG
jgi:hypothetical protein